MKVPISRLIFGHSLFVFRAVPVFSLPLKMTVPVSASDSVRAPQKRPALAIRTKHRKALINRVCLAIVQKTNVFLAAAR